MEVTEMDNSNTTVFKCKKCRSIIFTDTVVITGHFKPYAEFSDPYSSCESTLSENIWYLKEENDTDWMKEQLNMGEWMKGKLFCPKCKYRIGSFDFVSGALCPCKKNVLPPIHVLKRKVDCQLVTKVQQQVEEPKYGETSPMEYQHQVPTVILSHDCPSPVYDCLGPDSSGILVKNGMGNSKMLNIGIKIIKQKCSNHVLAPAKRKVWRRRNKRKNNSIQDSSASKIMPLQDTGVPSESVDSFRCSICLDLYLCPFTCQPCGHIYCEICLRRLARERPTHTICPMCRHLIVNCELNREISSQVKQKFPEEHSFRLKERDEDLLYSPLPGVTNYFSSTFPNDDDNMERTSLWTFFSSRQRTITILLFLKIFSVFMFLIGYYGSECITLTVKYIFSFLTLSKDIYETFIIVCISIYIAILLGIYIP